MYNIKHGCFRGRDSVPPCIDDVLEPEAPVAIDFNNSVLETLWCMDMMYAPRSQEVTIMDSRSFSNSCVLECVKKILDRFRNFMKKVISVFRVLPI